MDDTFHVVVDGDDSNRMSETLPTIEKSAVAVGRSRVRIPVPAVLINEPKKPVTT